MSRYTGPKHRLARREGANVLEKTSPALLRRLNIPPGMHGVKRKRKQSEYGRQLREKQKAKAIYGLSESQFRRYAETASQVKGRTGEVLLQLLERRLDNIAYRLGLAPSRVMARQLVAHGHVFINGKKVSIPSYRLRVGEVVALSPTALAIPAVEKKLKEVEGLALSYLEKEGPAGRLTKIPSREEIPTEIDEQQIIEYYSR